MKKNFASAIIITLITFSNFSKTFAQGIAINSTGAAPHTDAMLHVDAGTSATKGLLVTGTYNSTSTVPNLGAGSRLIFYPGKAAFRVGYVTGTQWDNANVGGYSTAIGLSTTASGYASTAMGFGTTASSTYSTAMGFGTTASGSTSTAMGFGTTASGTYSTAMGTYTTASGFNSTAMGSYTTASGNYSTAFGSNTTANGAYSTAMGYLVNANRRGVFAIGDSDPNNEGAMASSLDDAFIARFWNGFYLLTSGNNVRTGVQIAHGGNAWTTICDKNRKENFEPLDGEDVLQKISKIKMSSWNYKQQDPKIYRHYGIMAQDFYNAFGKDKFGTIGNDTTVNPIDMIGIDMAAIQALEKRTTQLKNENEKLKNENAAIHKKMTEVTQLKTENENLKQSVAQLQKQFDQQQKLIAQTLQELKTVVRKQKATAETVALNN